MARGSRNKDDITKITGLWKDPDTKALAKGTTDVSVLEEILKKWDSKSGNGKIGIYLFKNDYKEEDKHPDLVLQAIVFDEKEKGGRGQRSNGNSSRGGGGRRPSRPDPDEDILGDDDDGAPF